MFLFSARILQQFFLTACANHVPSFQSIVGEHQPGLAANFQSCVGSSSKGTGIHRYTELGINFRRCPARWIGCRGSTGSCPIHLKLGTRRRFVALRLFLATASDIRAHFRIFRQIARTSIASSWRWKRMPFGGSENNMSVVSRAQKKKEQRARHVENRKQFADKRQVT